ncbi:MAG: hypothetical protein FJ006_02445 [Chloroflexi bacterium]|nr:hypothetical protein [Chloroflexota bacterium]
MNVILRSPNKLGRRRISQILRLAQNDISSFVNNLNAVGKDGATFLLRLFNAAAYDRLNERWGKPFCPENLFAIETGIVMDSFQISI